MVAIRITVSNDCFYGSWLFGSSIPENDFRLAEGTWVTNTGKTQVSDSGNKIGLEFWKCFSEGIIF